MNEEQGYQPYSIKWFVGPAVGSFFIVAATLKGLGFLNIDTYPLRPDPVVGFLTQRETTILGAVFEVFIAIMLWKTKDLCKTGAFILYFCLCATIYQVGLAFNGNATCACLGIVSELIDDSHRASIIARSILAALWILGFGFMVSNRVHAPERISRTASPTSLMLLFLCFFGVTTSFSETIRVEGLYTARSKHATKSGSHKIVDSTPFVALFTREELKITYTQRPPSARSGVVSAACTHDVFVSNDHLATVSKCAGTDFVNVVLSRKEFPDQLGICRTALENSVFLTIRCKDLFAGPSGARRLSSPWALTGQPMALISEAKYEFTEELGKTTLLGTINVDATRLKHWTSSTLLSAGFEKQANQQRETIRLSNLQPGSPLAEFQFLNFTNVAGLQFPTTAEFRSFAPPLPRRDTTVDQQETAQSNDKDTMEVRIRRIEVVGDPVGLLPIQAEKVFVQDQRLFDRENQIDEGYFVTNLLSSLEISVPARVSFQNSIAKHKAELKQAMLRKIWTATLFLALVVGGVAILFASQKWRMRKQ